uniref:Clavesin-1 n=1 Tax=Cacopsylla melanoneura TaxID=428564 RepID=A0A8D8YU00_9HEMI
MADPRFRIESEDISEETRKVAEIELRETPEQVLESLKQLKQMLKEDNSIYFKEDDFLLQVFLRPCKYYPEGAFQLMKRIAEFKHKNADILENLLPKDEQNSLLNSNVANVLLDRDQHGRRILVISIGSSWDSKQVSTDQILRILYLIHLAAMQEPETQVKGGVILLDFEGLSAKQALQFTPSFSYKLLTFIQDAMPLRVKAVHIVKEPIYFNLVWKLFKPFIREKLKKRMYFHGSKMSSLHKHIHPDRLPANYDGNKPKIDYSSAQWYPVLNQIEDTIAEWNTFGRIKAADA